MKLAVTGATGFIGSRLAVKSVEQGHSVVLLGKVNTPLEEQRRRDLHDQGLTVIEAGLDETDKIAQLVQGCDVVFHLAAAQHEANVPDQRFWDVNVQGTRNMLDASVSAGVQRFVHGSTIGVYGATSEGEIDEDSPLRPDNIYGVTKRAGEELVLSYGGKIPVAIVRISETYGPGDGRLLKLFRGIDRRAFFIIGRGDNKHQLIYVDDLIDGLHRASQAPQAVGEILVLAGGEVLTTREMADTIAQAMDRRIPHFRAPLWPFLGIAVIMEKTLRPLGIQPPLHRRRMDFFRKSFLMSQIKATELLGFKAHTSFAQGVAETLRWYKSHGYL
jgi:dihydroflavonol-4-reductase